MEPQAAVAPLPCLPGHRRPRFSLAKRRHRPVMKAIPVRHGRIDGGPAGRRSALDRSCRIACPVSSALPGRWSIERRHAATRWPVRSRCVSIESIKTHECDEFKELSMLFFREVVSTFRQHALPGSSISQGRRFMGASMGSVVSHRAPADEGEPFRIRPRPLPSAVRSAAQIRQQRLPTGCAAAINDDYEAEMPSRLRQSLPRGCVRAHDRR